jgi:hypothetical protein
MSAVKREKEKSFERSSERKNRKIENLDKREETLQ